MNKLVKTYRNEVFRDLLNSLRTRIFINSFHFRSDDVIIVSYPKSGSTWLRFIIANLLMDNINNEPKEVDFLSTHMFVPEISKESIIKGVNFELLPSPRIMMTHSLYNSRFPKVIYLLRDGRDVLISYYYHFIKFHEYSGQLYDFIVNDRIRKIEWNEHVKSWLLRRSLPKNLLAIKYEEMLNSSYEQIKKIIYFIGIKQTDAQILKAIDSSDFNKMKQIEGEKGLGFAKEGDINLKFVRNAAPGEWKQVLGQEEKVIVKNRFGDVLIKMGYENSYEW